MFCKSCTVIPDRCRICVMLIPVAAISIEGKINTDDDILERTYLKKNKDDNSLEFVVIEYNSHGDATSYSFFNEAWQPIIDNDAGCFTVCQLFDSISNLVGRYYQNTDGTYMKNRKNDSTASFCVAINGKLYMEELNEYGVVTKEEKVGVEKIKTSDDPLLHLIDTCAIF